MLIISYPLFQAGKILALRAKKWLSSVSGREGWHFVLISLVYPLFQAGKILALCANNWLSSVSGREG